MRHDSTSHFDGNPLLGEGSRHQQTANELTADIRLNLDETAAQPIGLDDDRRTVIAMLAASTDTELR